MHSDFSPRQLEERAPIDRRRVLWTYDGMHRALTRATRRSDPETAAPLDASRLEPYFAWADRKYDLEGEVEPLALRRFSCNMDISVLPEELVLRFSPPSWRLDRAQLFALTRSLLPVSLVWGAPENDPVTPLSAIAAMHAAMGHQVFVLAPTGEAADEAALGVDAMLTRLFGAPLPGAVVRAGAPGRAAPAGQERMFAWDRAARRHAAAIALARGELAALERALATVPELWHAELHARRSAAYLGLGWATSRQGREHEELCARALVVVATVEDAFLEPVLRDLMCSAPPAGEGPAPSPSAACRALINWTREHPMDADEADPDGPGRVPTIDGRRRTLIFHGATAIPRYAALPLFDVHAHHVILLGGPKERTPALPQDLAGDPNARFWLEESLFDAAGFHDGDSCRQALAGRGALTNLAATVGPSTAACAGGG